MGLPMKDWRLALRILRYEDDVENEPEEAPRRGRRWIWVIVVLGLAATGSASTGLRAPGHGDQGFRLKDGIDAQTV
jgi:hypothetical protein